MNQKLETPKKTEQPHSECFARESEGLALLVPSADALERLCPLRVLTCEMGMMIAAASQGHRKDLVTYL